jgi:hypothetical protein
VNPAPPTIVGVSRVVCSVLVLLAVALSTSSPSQTAGRGKDGLVPRGASLLGRWKVAAGSRIGAQVLVEWQRGRDPDPRRNRYVLALWQSVPNQSEWRRLFQVRLFPADGQVVRVQQADVTRDGHLDQVVTGPTQGSGDCGPRRVLGTIEGRVRQIFRLPPITCDTDVSGVWGGIVVSRGSYTAHDSHCCPTFTSKETLRWDGTRLRRVGTALFWNCTEHFCWGRRPLYFSARASAFWDSRRGIAVGGARPWLIASTGDGGHSWRIRDASPVPLGRPQLEGSRRARIRFLACHHHCHGSRFAATATYGATWLATPRQDYYIWPG